jgi:hypothetical protein
MAVNVDRPNGFRPVGTLSGGDWTASIRTYLCDTGHDAIFIGDLIHMDADGYVDQYDAGDTQVIGVCVGVEVNRGLDSKTEHPGYLPANVAGKIRVATDPLLLMEAQEDGDTTPLTLADINTNVEIIDGGGSTTTGISGQEIDSTTKNTTNTLPLRLVALVDRPDNQLASVDSTKPNARWLVTFANHAWKGLDVAV